MSFLSLLATDGSSGLAEVVHSNSDVVGSAVDVVVVAVGRTLPAPPRPEEV